MSIRQFDELQSCSNFAVSRTTKHTTAVQPIVSAFDSVHCSTPSGVTPLRPRACVDKREKRGRERKGACGGRKVEKEGRDRLFLLLFSRTIAVWSFLYDTLAHKIPVSWKPFTLPYLVSSLESGRVEERLRPPHVRVRYATGLSAREGQAVGGALLELVRGLVIHAVHHVQVTQPKVNLDTTEKSGGQKRYTSGKSQSIYLLRGRVARSGLLDKSGNALGLAI